MRSRLAIPFVLLLALTGACSSDTAKILRGGLNQPSETVIVHSRLFVTSLRHDALKVAQLSDGASPDAWVAAPNPVYSLQIPVLRRPASLAGLEVAGGRPLVAVTSSIDPQIRLVDADALVPLGAPVTLPGRPVALTADPNGEGFWLVVESDAGAAVVELVPTAAALDPSASVSESDVALTQSKLIPIDIVPGGLAMTDASGSMEAWVSDLGGPDVLRVDTESGTAQSVPSGFSLGLLAASPVVEGDRPLPEGAYVYGLVRDEPGIVALDVRAGAVAAPLDFGGQVLPIPLSSEPTSLTAVSSMTVAAVNAGTTGSGIRPGLVDLLLIVPMVDSTVAFVDGARMLPVDVDGNMEPDPSFAVTPSVISVEDNVFTGDLDMTAPVLTTRPNPDYDPAFPTAKPRLVAEVSTTDGVTRTRTWHVGYQPLVKGQDGVVGSLDTGSGQVAVEDGTTVDLSDRVEPGDTLSITDWYSESPPAGCDTYATADPPTWTISAVEGNRLVLAAIDGGVPLPTGACFPTDFLYEVRAQGYLVWADDLDQVFRIAPGEGFTYQGERFVKTSPVVNGPDIHFTLAADQDPTQMQPGADRTIAVSSGIDPLLFVPGTAVTDLNQTLVQTMGYGLPAASMPGRPVVLRDATNGSRGRVYVPYAGSGYILSFTILTRTAYESLD